MGSRPGYIELERALDSIRVGRRHRADLGDIGELAASIEREGLLQPITIAPDGVLVCGLRRLAAMRQLGWRTANVWVRSGISDELGQLLAEQDENALHKPLTQTEQAALYRELKALLAEDAARRQEASRFPADGQKPRSHGGATVAPPSSASGKTREQAALMVTGRNSYTSLERISELQRVAADPTVPSGVRDRAAAELAGIDAGGSIRAAHQRTSAEVSLTELDRLAVDPMVPMGMRERAKQDAARLRASQAQTRAGDLERLAAEALARVRAGQKRPRHPRPAPTPAAGVMTVRAFVLTWDELTGWWERCDPTEVAAALTDDQWERFQNTLTGTIRFAEAISAARASSEPRTA
ncbi:ParB N-terminal domain-containing protein [Sinomonas terrae]|uniref:ParB/RepB/Spo0J family partition protein n=1 Tax=Sinomonas terrae TaxID=2908838 RepID=A0ABS9U248_9MICC|nr:ParB/RepB/Spo0J family partition protein [Sinomonas terrae]MCH6470781.1 ParB/RepB/Spo0J family partition protein [Sinomonas terrae]